jgi:hypothetical protein
MTNWHFLLCNMVRLDHLNILDMRQASQQFWRPPTTATALFPVR